MGISTKVAKRIVQNVTTRYPGYNGKWMITSNLYPEFMVILNEDDDPPWVVTVLHRTYQYVVRDGAGYKIPDDSED